jgi:hypothetical protein
VVVLLDDVRAPARHARHREDRRVQLRRNFQHREDRRRVEIDVGAKLFLSLHRRFQVFANRHPLFLAQALAEIARDLPHNRHPRIAFFVNAMAKAHDLLLLRQRFHHPFLRTIGRADFVEHFHRLFVRAAVERTFQRPAGRSGRRVHVRQGRSRDARRESRGVEFVVGIKNVDRVEHPDLPILRNPSGQFVEEIPRVSEIRFVLDRLLPLRNAPAIGDEGRNATEQADRFAHIGGV